VTTTLRDVASRAPRQLVTDLLDLTSEAAAAVGFLIGDAVVLLGRDQR